MDMNDRVLRNIVVGLGSKVDGTVREDHLLSQLRQRLWQYYVLQQI